MNSTIYLSVCEDWRKLAIKLSKHADNTRSFDDADAPLAVPETRKSDWLTKALRLSKALDASRL